MSIDSPIMNMTNIELSLSSTTSPHYVTRQDSGVPDDLSTPSDKESSEQQDDEQNITTTTGSINDNCNNTTVINVNYVLLENKENKDGSDSGVEGCAIEIPRVRVILKDTKIYILVD